MSLSSFFRITNNPANIRFSKDNNWLGQIGEQKGFCCFIDQIFGVRALRVLLRNYINSGCNTISSIVSRFAPPSENCTDSYCKFVSDEFISHGLNPDSEIEFDSFAFRVLIQAICKFETGFILTLEEYNYVCSRFI